MARRIKSLHFNKEDGIDIPQHREHRSKKCRSRSIIKTPAIRLYKKKKNELKYENIY